METKYGAVGGYPPPGFPTNQRRKPKRRLLMVVGAVVLLCCAAMWSSRLEFVGSGLSDRDQFKPALDAFVPTGKLLISQILAKL
jgi:hypothetical protein